MIIGLRLWGENMNFYFRYTVGQQEKVLEINCKDTSVVLEKSWLNFWGPNADYRVCGWQRMTGYTDDFYVQTARYGGDCYAPWSYLYNQVASQSAATALVNAGVPDWNDTTYQLVLDDMTHDFLNAQDIADNDIHSYSYQVLKIGNTGSCRLNFAKKTVYEQGTPVTKFANKAFAGFDPYHNDGSVTGFITYPDNPQDAIVYDSTLREPNLFFAIVKVHDDDQNSPHYDETVDVIVILRSVYMDGYTPPVGSEICFVDARLFDTVEPKVEPTKSTTRGNTPNGFRGDRNDGSDSDTESHISTRISSYANKGNGLHLYGLNRTEYSRFNNALWDTNLWRSFQNYKWNPVGGVCSLHLMPCDPDTLTDGEAQTVRSCGLELEYESVAVTGWCPNNTTAEIVTSTIKPAEYSGSFLDWGYTTARFRLPFIGVIPVDISKIMSGGIFAKYNIDFVTGNCLAQLYTIPSKDVMGKDGDWDDYRGAEGCLCMIGQYAGNCAHKLPYSGNDNGAGGVVGGIVGTVMSFGTAAISGVMGNVPLAVGGVLSGIANTAKTSMAKHNVDVNYATPNADSMGMMVPALILERPIDITPLSPDNRATVYGEFAGRPAASGGTVKDYSEFDEGHVFIQGVIHADTLYATEAEKREIEQGFAKGMYV